MGNRRAMLTVALLTIPAAAAADYRLTTVAGGLDHPWCIAFLPDGDLLVTERTGQLRRISSGVVSPPISGVPDVFFAGQGGLHDVVLDPDFESNRLLYLSYAHGNGSANATRVARGRLDADALHDVQVIFTVQPSKDTPMHYGGKLAFLSDGTLLLTTGDGFDYREQAQSVANQLGKTIRINADGSIPDDNPFVGAAGADPAVWTYGHRNPQGLAVDPATGRVFQHEHGPRGGDEINELVPGRNYGWPAITYGIDYSGAYVSPYTELPGMEQPLKVWVPSIAPSGLAVYRGERFPDWNGDLLIGALVNQEVRRVDLSSDTEEALFAELDARIRDVRVDDRGYVYVVTDGPDGKIVRVE